MPRRGITRGMLLAILSGVLSGCLSGRMADLRDVAKLSVHGGLGFSVDARLGVLTQPSFGLWSTSMGVGFESRDVSGVYFFKRINFPYSIAYLRGAGRPTGSALLSTGWYANYQVRGFQRAFEEIDRPLSTRPPRELGKEIDGVRYGGTLREGAWLPLPDDAREAPLSESFMEWTQFDFGAQAGPFGGRAGANPLELVDFLLGFVGIDIASDDAPSGTDIAGETSEAEDDD